MRLRKIILVVAIITTMIFMLTANVFASDVELLIEGDSAISPNGTKTLSVKISTEENVGMVSGKISKNEHITNMTIKETNGWTVELNEETGDFIVYKAEGATTEEIMTIEYTVDGTGEKVYGDVNCDGEVNANDVLALQEYLGTAESYTELTAQGRINADVNDDKNINELDEIIITRHLEGTEGYENLPYEGKLYDDINLDGNVDEKDAELYIAGKLIWGDVNCDGKVDESDPDHLVKYMVGDYEGYELTDQGQINADINRDGTITMLDVVMLLRHLERYDGFETLPYSTRQATITIRDIEITTIGYQTIEKEDITKTISIENLMVSSNTYTATVEGENKFIEGIKPETTISGFLTNIETNGEIEIYEGTTKITDTATLIATGMKVKVIFEDETEECEIVVAGDMDGDGKMTTEDQLKLIRYKIGLDTDLSGAYLRASDINQNGIKSQDIDLLKLIRVLVGLDTL